MKSIDRQLPANSGQIVHAVGTFIWLKEATGPIHIKTDAGETAFLSSGEFVRTDEPFTQFFVTDLSGAQNDLTFNTSQNGEAGKYGIVNIQKPSTFNDVADVSILAATATLILAADSNRHEAIITSDAANVGNVRIGSSSVGAARGTPLSANGVLILETTAAIYAYSTNITKYQINYTGF